MHINKELEVVITLGISVLVSKGLPQAWGYQKVRTNCGIFQDKDPGNQTDLPQLSLNCFYLHHNCHIVLVKVWRHWLLFLAT